MNDQSAEPSLVVVGNGMVAGRLLDELLAKEGTTYQITIIGAEPQGSYNRIMLSSVLAKDASVESIIHKDASWYQSKGIKFYSGVPATFIDRTKKFVELETGERIPYDELVMATGSDALRIPAQNVDLKNIYTFRTIGDTQSVMDIAQNAQTALVVGGGLLGLEAAYGLAKFGTKVYIVNRCDWLLNRQLDERAATMLQNVMASMNIDFYLGDEVQSFHGDDSVSAVTLTSGVALDIDLAVVAIGVRPNGNLGLGSGLAGQRAIQVNDYMQTSDPHISAVGECIEHDGNTFGLVDPLWRQAETLASRLVENKLVPFKNAAIATKLKVSGVNVFSAGLVETESQHREVLISDPKANIYRKLLIENNRIVGIVLFGDVRSGPYYFDLMQNETDVSDLLPTLILGEAFLPSLTAA